MTPESIQDMIDQALLRNSTNGDGSHSSHGDNRRNVQTARPCFYADFMKCQPLNFKGTEGMVGLTRWIEKMESVFNISGCAIENQVKFATCTLLGSALTWWNGQIRTLGNESYAMTWEGLKKKMTDKYCPQGEIKKLSCGHGRVKFVAMKPRRLTSTSVTSDNIMMGTSSLPDQVVGLRLLSWPIDLMDPVTPPPTQKGNSDNKRKADDSSRNNHGHQQQPFKRQNVAKVYNMGTGERKPYGGSLPKCTKCHLHHNGPCTQRRALGQAPKEMVFSSVSPGHFKEIVFLEPEYPQEEEDKSERKQIKDIPIVRDFPEVFPEDLPGLPPARTG
ncbi:hypothetical protein Tco_0497774 [Tanacetum coccineum]